MFGRGARVAMFAVALTAAAGAAPAHAAGRVRPVRGRVVVVAPVHGRVRVKLRGHRRYTRVVRATAVPVGSTLDSSRGMAVLTISTIARDWSARVSRGVTRIMQAHSGTATLTLSGSLECPRTGTASVARARSRSVALDASGGPFEVRGRYVLGRITTRTAHREQWTTTDLCGRSTVTVQHGAVAVTDLVSRHTVTVHAGHSVAVAPAPRFAWATPIPIGPGSMLNGIACPTTGLCAAVDSSGNIITSTNPGGGSGAWTAAPVSSSLIGLVAITCPTTSFCLAADSAGNQIWTSTDPTGGSGAWTATTLPDGLADVTCPTTTLCVGVDINGDVLTSTAPTAGASAWSSGQVSSGALDAVACAGTALCVAGGGGISASRAPAAGASTWRTDSALNAINAISCPTANLCVLADDSGNVYVSTDPAGGAATYHQPHGLVDSHHPFQPATGLACQASGACVLVGLSGDVVTTADAVAGDWSTATVDQSGLTGVACPVASTCYATDQSGDLVTGELR